MVVSSDALNTALKIYDRQLKRLEKRMDAGEKVSPGEVDKFTSLIASSIEAASRSPSLVSPAPD